MKIIFFDQKDRSYKVRRDSVFREWNFDAQKSNVQHSGDTEFLTAYQRSVRAHPSNSA